MADFYKGAQIAYVPLHAQFNRREYIYEDGKPAGYGFEWDITHPDVELGFVMSQRGDTVFCRYWRKGQPGTLRTRANSAGTPEDCLVPYESSF